MAANLKTTKFINLQVIVMKISEAEYIEEIKLIAQQATCKENEIEKTQCDTAYININDYVFQILEKHRYTTCSMHCLSVLFLSHNNDAYFHGFDEIQSTDLFDTCRKLATAAMFEDVLKALDDIAGEADDI